jgi:hypothetical protein
METIKVSAEKISRIRKALFIVAFAKLTLREKRAILLDFNNLSFILLKNAFAEDSNLDLILLSLRVSLPAFLMSLPFSVEDF